MKPSLPAFILMLTASAAAVFLAASCGKPGWPVFRSLEDCPEAPDPAFSVRYPPWFEKTAEGGRLVFSRGVPESPDGREGGIGHYGPANSGWPMKPFRVEIASRPDPRTEGAVYLYVLADPFGEADRAKLAEMGPVTFWREVGETLASPPGGRFRGSGALAQHGSRGADVMFTSDRDPFGVRGGVAYLFIRRYLMKGDLVVSAVCAVPDPLRDARRDNFSLLDFPAVRGVCVPFLDSLELIR